MASVTPSFVAKVALSIPANRWLQASMHLVERSTPM